MKSIFLFQIVFILLFDHSFAAQEIKLEEQFRPYMVDHINEGCPANSECNEVLGQKRKQWEESLKKYSAQNDLKTLMQKVGHPFKVWFEPKKSGSLEVISWHSPCESHNKENHIIRTAEVFLRSPIKEKEDEKILFHRIYLQEGKKVTQYIIPRDETPLYKSGDELVFLLENKGQYFGLEVNSRNQFSLIKTPSTQIFPEVVACPKGLSEHFNKNAPKGLYQFFNCKAIWNKKTKKFETFIVGKACA